MLTGASLFRFFYFGFVFLFFKFNNFSKSLWFLSTSFKYSSQKNVFSKRSYCFKLLEIICVFIWITIVYSYMHIYLYLLCLPFFHFFIKIFVSYLVSSFNWSYEVASLIVNCWLVCFKVCWTRFFFRLFSITFLFFKCFSNRGICRFGLIYHLFGFD